jgi:GNAT superfamily N-acetyltransferase
LICELAGADEVAGDQHFWSIYRQSFPESEREPPAVILEAQRSGVGVITRAREDGRTVGLASAHRLRDPAALFLVYLAVADGRRGQRIGAALFEHIAGHAGLPLIWEVDPPDSPDELEQRRRERRIAFFRRAGGELLPRPYQQPPLSPGAPPVPMRLMARPAPPDVEALVRAIYFEKYGAQNGIAEATLRALLP